MASLKMKAFFKKNIPFSIVDIVFEFELHVCHQKNPLTFHYTGWSMGILISLIMIYYNPYITG